MMDELAIEEMSIRAVQEKMDEAFRAAMQRAINAGEEHAATLVSKKQVLGTRKSFWLNTGSAQQVRQFAMFAAIRRFVALIPSAR